MWILWTLAGLSGLIVVFAIIAILIGLRHDRNHVVARAIRLKQTPEAIWAVISDHGNEGAWQSHVQSSRRLPDQEGHPVWELKHRGAGNPLMTLKTTVFEPPTRMVRTIDDAKKVFSGRWEFILTKGEGETRVAITEHGEIPSPFFRGMFHLFANPATYLEMYLSALARKFGETPTFEPVP